MAWQTGVAEQSIALNMNVDSAHSLVRGSFAIRMVSMARPLAVAELAVRGNAVVTVRFRAVEGQTMPFY